MKGIYQKYIAKKITLYAACIVLLIIVGSSFTKDEKINKEDAAYKTSQEAFMDVYKVLMSPRCMNCHPSGDAPLQGDDSHIHTMNVQRGRDGRGLYALKCANCHQPANTPGLNMPPGNPNWRLPADNMKLVFQGRTPKQLAMQLKDPKQNGGKTLEQLYHHVAEDALVLWGWASGDGRTLPPLSHDEFAKAFRTWIDNGAAIPD